MAVSPQDSFESMLCDSGARLVMSGLKKIDCRDDILLFVNAGGHQVDGRVSLINLEDDYCFKGGDTIETEEVIAEGGDYPSVYNSARFGDFSYEFDGLSRGDYFVDLHFAEIINTNGPKGIRVFDVYMHDEKILSDIDIYSVVGANMPLQIVDIRVSVDANGSIVVKFEGKSGTPIVCGICIRKASKLSEPMETFEHLACDNCASEIEFSPIQNKARRMKIIAKYDQQIQELTSQFKMKSNECYEAWMSLSDANAKLESLEMENDRTLFLVDNLDQTIEKQARELRDITERCEHDKRKWATGISNLEAKFKEMKREHHQLSHNAHECANSIPDLNKMIDAVQILVVQCDDLRTKYNEELAKRKKLFNQVQEAKGNIRVFCRCRPLSKEEVLSRHATVVDFEASKDGDLGIISAGSSKKIFKFDQVYTPKDDQADVYADASPLVTSVLDGYNVCIFAYGQTGTGKTFTMEGSEHNRGVNYRTLEELFKIASDRKETFAYSISVSVLEVYNEQIRDLLATSPSSKKLEVRQVAEGSHHVPGIVEAKVENIKEVWDVLQAGSNARVVGSNNVNEHSSRSHCMLCIMVSAKNLLSGECTKSKLWLVDLAGSERLAKTDVQGERLKEAQNINRSLSALGDVISSLASKSSHIPYRNSKLTHLLQDSLGGDSKTLMFVQISPSENDVGETISSLNFASRVRGIDLGPARKQVDTGELQKVKQMLDKARQECRIKEESMRKLEDNCQNLESKVRGKDQVCRNLQEKNKELEGQLDRKAELLGGKEEAYITLQHKVKELECKLKDQQHSETLMLQQKVKELENKLREQLYRESLSEQKARELELKLKERRQSETILEQKTKELEFKLQERRQSETILEQKVKELQDKLREEFSRSSANASKSASPEKRKSFSREESMSEIDPQILRSSNSVNRPLIGQGTILTKGAEPIPEIKRKRDLGEYENEMQLPRRVDQAKALRRTTRTVKVASTQKGLLHHSSSSSRVNKDQMIGGIKDRSRGWH